MARAAAPRTLLVTSAVVSLVIQTAFALDPTKATTQYQLDVWTEREGLPQSTVQAITQTPEGYLWVGTRDGLARFDGAAFTVFNSEKNPGLNSNDIRALYVDRAGHLWIGTFNGGLSCYAGGSFRNYSSADGLPSNGVIDICEDRFGNLWLGTWNGVVRFGRGKFIVYNAENGLVGRSVRSIQPDPRGSFLWVGTSHALNKLELTGPCSLSVGEVFRDKELREILLEEDGVLWAGSLAGGLLRLQEGMRKRYTVAEGLADTRVNTLLRDRDGNLWVGTWGGLSRMCGDRIANLTRQDGLPHDCVEALFEDREGNLWVGTRGGGLARLRDASFTVFTVREGLASDLAQCVLETRDGTLWVGTEGGGLSCYRAGKFTTYTTKNALPSDFVCALAEAPDGAVWAGSAHPGRLVRFQDGVFTTFGHADGLSVEHRVRAIFADREGNVWCGGDQGGLCRYREGKFTAFTTADGLLDDLVRVIGEDREGHLWVGTGNGLCRFDGTHFQGFTRKDGLAQEAVYSMYEDGEGTLWFGTQHGLTRYFAGKFTSYDGRHGLVHSLIYQVLEDDDQRLWLASNRGVFSLSKQAIAEYDRGKLSVLPCAGFGVADGMKTSQCQGGCQPAGWKGRDGNLWFATAQGVAMINPRRMRRGESAPSVLIEQVIAGDKAIGLTERARLSPSTRQLRFHYTALCLAIPEKVLFQYRLEGFDRNWVQAGTRRVAFYNKIPPGEYLFHVIACNSDGVWNTTGAAFAFSLAPYFYQRAWFYLVCAAALGAGAWSFHRSRMQRAKAGFSLILSERNRIARDLHDTLAQGFAGIAFQLEAVAAKLRDAPGEAKHHLDLALAMVRHSLTEARHSVLNLRSRELESRDLAAALSETAHQMVADRAIQLDFQTQGAGRRLPMALENQLLRIGQEAITNSLKHAHASQLRVALEYQPQAVILRIKDDGQGFNPAALPGTDGVHFGLMGMRERARKLGAQLEIKSGHQQGTEVLVHVPMTGNGKFAAGL